MVEFSAITLAHVLVVIHAAYLIYLVIGGFGAWVRPAAFWPHAVAVVWALAVVTFAIDCPLTEWENQLRVVAGEQPYEESFIEHYVAGLIYPKGQALAAESLAAFVVFVSWIPPGVRAWHRLRDRTRATARTQGRDGTSSHARLR